MTKKTLVSCRVDLIIFWLHSKDWPLGMNGTRQSLLHARAILIKILNATKSGNQAPDCWARTNRVTQVINFLYSVYVCTPIFQSPVSPAQAGGGCVLNLCSVTKFTALMKSVSRNEHSMKLGLRPNMGVPSPAPAPKTNNFFLYIRQECNSNSLLDSAGWMDLPGVYCLISMVFWTLQ